MSGAHTSNFAQPWHHLFCGSSVLHPSKSPIHHDNEAGETSCLFHEGSTCIQQDPKERKVEAAKASTNLFAPGSQVPTRSTQVCQVSTGSTGALRGPAGSSHVRQEPTWSTCFCWVPEKKKVETAKPSYFFCRGSSVPTGSTHACWLPTGRKVEAAEALGFCPTGSTCTYQAPTKSKVEAVKVSSLLPGNQFPTRSTHPFWFQTEKKVEAEASNFFSTGSQVPKRNIHACWFPTEKKNGSSRSFKHLLHTKHPICGGSMPSWHLYKEVPHWEHPCPLGPLREIRGHWVPTRSTCALVFLRGNSNALYDP